MAGNAYRDGRVHVLSERCPTCVFRPGNLMALDPGRLRELIDDNRSNDSALTCHETLLTTDNAICRGFFDLEPKTTPLQIAERIGVITFVEPPCV
jgi:hypothetical protein